MEQVTSNFTKRDAINARNSFALQDLDNGAELIIVKAGILNRPDLETGETKEVAVLITEDNTVYSSISATVCETLGDIVDIIEDEHAPISIRLNKRKSKGGREFLTITVL